MPLYEYQCKSCHTLTERIQKFSDPPLTVCPHCGGELEQLLSAPAVQFKGSGWYVTDYARKSSPGTRGNGSSSESKSGEAQSGGSSAAEKSSPSSEPPNKK
ncbi:MAG: zinc ribbon domain-containing protein [Candidatus Korobacteraceae bacterium]